MSSQQIKELHGVELNEVGQWTCEDTHQLLSYTEYLHIVPIADCNPVWLGGGPLDLIDLTLGGIGQDWYLYRLRHRLDVPDKSLVIISCREGKETNNYTHSQLVD